VLWNLLEEIDRAVWKIPIQLLPAILMRDAGCQIDAASSTKFNALEVWIDPMYV